MGWVCVCVVLIESLVCSAFCSLLSTDSMLFAAVDLKLWLVVILFRTTSSFTFSHQQWQCTRSQKILKLGYSKHLSNNSGGSVKKFAGKGLG